MGTALIFLGLLVFSAHLFSMIFSKKKIPDVLLLLIIGVLIGPVLNLVTPEDFGSMGSVFTSVTLVVILFEGGTGISISDLKESWRSTIKLTASSFLSAAFPYTLLSITGAAFCFLSSFLFLPQLLDQLAHFLRCHFRMYFIIDHYGRCQSTCAQA